MYAIWHVVYFWPLCWTKKCDVWSNQESSAKKRKSEWQAGLTKLPGDVTLVKVSRQQQKIFVFNLLEGKNNWLWPWRLITIKHSGYFRLPVTVHGALRVKQPTHAPSFFRDGCLQERRRFACNVRKTTSFPARSAHSTWSQIWGGDSTSILTTTFFVHV